MFLRHRLLCGKCHEYYVQIVTADRTCVMEAFICDFDFVNIKDDVYHPSWDVSCLFYVWLSAINKQLNVS